MPQARNDAPKQAQQVRSWRQARARRSTVRASAPARTRRGSARDADRHDRRLSNVDAARSVTRYLLKRGCWPVGYIGAYPKDNDRARDRRLGYETAFAGARRKRDPTLCIETTLDVEAGAKAMAAMLDRRPDVRAVFCSADAIAVGALHECQRRRLDIPGRIAIAGFDDIPIAAQVVPALTTLRVPRYEIGQRAGKMIRDRLAKRTIRQRVVDTGFKLVPRDSA